MKELYDIKTYYGEVPPRYARFIIRVLEALDKRLTTTEHDAFEAGARLEAIEAVQGEQKPLSCCEGCADYPCNHPPDRFNKATVLCYREKRTCGKCHKAYWSADDNWLGGCRLYSADEPWHPINRGYPACPNFKVTQ